MTPAVRKEIRPLTERERRVEEIRRRVAEGVYEVDPLELSRAILRRHSASQDPEPEPDEPEKQ